MVDISELKITRGGGQSVVLIIVRRNFCVVRRKWARVLLRKISLSDVLLPSEDDSIPDMIKRKTFVVLGQDDEY